MSLGRSGIRRLFADDLPIQVSIANVASIALSFLTVPIIARAVGAEGRGETAAVVAAFVFVPVILGIGIPLEVRRLCASGISEPVIRSARDIVVALFLPAAGISAALGLTIFSSTGESVRMLAIFGVAATPLSVSWSVDAAALVGAGRYRGVFLLRITQPAMVLALMIPAWVADLLTPSSILVIYLLGNAATTVLGLTLVRISWRGPRAERRGLARAGISFAGSAIAESASAKLDQILVLPLIGATEAGYYTLATSISILPIAISHALAARHFREMANAGSTQVGQIVRNGIRECASLTAPLSLLIAGSSFVLIPLVFGDEFAPSIGVLLILLPGSFAMAITYVGSMLLAARGRGAIMTATQVAALSVDMLFLVPLASLFSANGAAMASSIAYLSLLVMQLLALRASLLSILPTPKGVRAALRSLAT